MRSAIVGFVAGAACLQVQPSLPDYPGSALILAMPLIFVLMRRGRPHAGALLRSALAMCAGGLFGFLWAALIAQAAMSPELAKSDEGRDVTLIGTIDSLPNRFSQGARFNFAVEQVVGGAMRVPPRVALSWYSGFRGETLDIGDVQPGERWQLTVRLQRPHGNANPHGFDYELWQLEQGVRATGYVRGEEGAGGSNRRLDNFVFSFRNVVEHCRAVLRARILHALQGREYAGVIVALVVGDQRSIDQSDWQVFNRTGISHLISISGLHITMIAGLFALAASWLWRHSFFTDAQLPLLLPAQKVAALAGLLAALLYVLLAGFGVPAQRTLYMLAVVALALWTGRISGVSHVLCLAAGVVVLLDPWAVMWPGFWLSFGAVAVIMYATVGRTSVHAGGERAVALSAARDADAMGFGSALSHASAMPSTRGGRLWLALKMAAHTQYVVTLGLVPLTMLLFAQVSLISPLANAVAIPLISLVVTPLALVGSLLPEVLAAWLLVAAHEVVWLLAQALQWFSASRFAVWSAPAPPWWVFCWALFGMAWMLAPRGWPLRWLGLATWIPLLAAVPEAPPPGIVRVTAFDVGQGMALLVETSGHRLLYDTGPSYTPDSNGGNRVIVPYLRARGIGALDGLIVSHGDSDHAGGALSVMESVRVGWAATSLPAAHAVVRAAPKHVPCAAGQAWTWDGVRFEMLHPTADSYRDAGLKTNARSCTLKVSVGGRAMLLAGDIEAQQEAELLARGPARLAADVLLAPHHGSGTSSTAAFLAAVGPSVAIFQVGHRNRYRHPQAQVWQRYGSSGVQRIRTDVWGATTVTFGPQLAVSRYREQRRRYWQDALPPNERI